MIRRAVSKILNHFIPKDAAMWILWGPMRGMRWIKGSGDNGYWLGIYESEKQKALLKLTHLGMTVYDIGAHAGFFTLFFAKLVAESGMVVAFEPYPPNIDLLEKHVEINGIQNVRIEKVAVSDQAGEAWFGPKGSSATGQINRQEGGLKVRLARLDGLNLPPPDLVKIDVEGNELAVLEGMGNRMFEKKPTLVIELGNLETRKSISEFLRDRGYETFDLRGRMLSGESALRTDEIVAKVVNM